MKGEYNQSVWVMDSNHCPRMVFTGGHPRITLRSRRGERVSIGRTAFGDAPVFKKAWVEHDCATLWAFIRLRAHELDLEAPPHLYTRLNYARTIDLIKGHILAGNRDIFGLSPLGVEALIELLQEQEAE